MAPSDVEERPEAGGVEVDPAVHQVHRQRSEVGASAGPRDAEAVVEAVEGAVVAAAQVGAVVGHHLTLIPAVEAEGDVPALVLVGADAAVDPDEDALLLEGSLPVAEENAAGRDGVDVGEEIHAGRR